MILHTVTHTGSRCSAEAAKAVARIVGVPPEMPLEPAPAQPFVPPESADTPALQASAAKLAMHAHAAVVATAVCLYTRMYVAYMHA